MLNIELFKDTKYVDRNKIKEIIIQMMIFVYILINHWVGRGVMVFNATFNNISVISWRSVLLMEETGENHQPVASH
jgi:hypothetical protein